MLQHLQKVGITIAAGLINFVVITAAMSGCNSGIFSSSRMVYTLAQKGQMPRIFTKVMKTGVPFFAVLAISIGIFVGVILNIVLPLVIDGSENIFVYVYSASILPGMVPWFMILFSHIQFRRHHSDEIKDHPFKMPFAPYSNYLTLGFFILVLIGMLFNSETRVSVIIGIVFLSVMAIVYFLRGYHKEDKGEY